MTTRRRMVAVAAGGAIALAAFGLTGCAGATVTASGDGATTRTAAPTASPTPTAAVDLSIHRTFTLTDGTTATCTIDFTVEPDPAAPDPDAPERARAVLAATDWQTVPVALSQMPEDEQAARRAQGVGEGEMLAMILQDDIHTALTTAGANAGVQTRSHTVC